MRTLKSKLQYCYADYIEAWYTIFLHQTIDFSHSWFINFDNKFKSPFPFWFLHWWEKHGPVAEILPLQVHEVTKYFSSRYTLKESELFFPNQLIFIANYKIPWILKWSYNVNWENKVLFRQFSVKWWYKFKVERIAEYVYRDYPPPVASQKPTQKPSSSSTSHSSLQVEGKSKTELQEIARQLIIQASQMRPC